MNPLNRFRLFHALFVLGFLAVYFSGDDGDPLHVWLGYGLVVLLTARLVVALSRVKGFPALWPVFRTHAVPITVSRLLVMALFLAASVTVVTGLIMVDHSRVLGLTARPMMTPVDTDDEEWEGSGRGIEVFSSDAIEEAHEMAANTTLGLAALHIGFLLAFRRRFALNMIPGFGPAAKNRNGPTAKVALASGASAVQLAK